MTVGTIIYKCSLKGRLDFDYLAKVDVSKYLSAMSLLYVKVVKSCIIHYCDTRFIILDINQYFLFVIFQWNSLLRFQFFALKWKIRINRWRETRFVSNRFMEPLGGFILFDPNK